MSEPRAGGSGYNYQLARIRSATLAPAPTLPAVNSEKSSRKKKPEIHLFTAQGRVGAGCPENANTRNLL